MRIFYPVGVYGAFHRKFGRLFPDNNNNKRANGTISKLFRKYLSNVPGKHKVKELEKIAILNTVHTHRKY